MVKRPQDTVRFDPSCDAVDLTQLYRSRAQELPPAYLDSRILAAANTVPPKPWVPHGPFDRWAAPTAAVAVIVLCVTLMLHISREGLPPFVTHVSEKNDAPAIRDQAPNHSEKTAKAMESAPPASLRAKPVPRDSVTPETHQFAADEYPRKPSAAPAIPQEQQKFPTRSRQTEQGSGLVANEMSPKTMGPGVPSPAASILAVAVNGSAGAYQFTVTINNHSLDCDRGADWWEIVSKDGSLIYRRLLQPHHVGQPTFDSVGGPVAIDADTVVWVRLHQGSAGYATTALKGSVTTGFQERSVSRGFADDLARLPPLPSACNP